MNFSDYKTYDTPFPVGVKLPEIIIEKKYYDEVSCSDQEDNYQFLRMLCFKKLKEKYTDHKIVLTFLSPSGYEVKKSSSIADVVVYLPLDSNKNAKDFLKTVNPTLVVFVKNGNNSILARPNYSRGSCVFEVLEYKKSMMMMMMMMMMMTMVVVIIFGNGNHSPKY